MKCLVIIVLFSLLFSSSAVVNPSDDSEACEKKKRSFPPLVLKYGVEIIRSTCNATTRDPNNTLRLVLLSDLSWSVVRYLFTCEEEFSSSSSTFPRYIHLVNMTPLRGISWPAYGSKEEVSTADRIIDFMSLNVPHFNEEDGNDGEEEDEGTVSRVFVETNLITTSDIGHDGTWRDLYSATPWGFMTLLTRKKMPQWKYAYKNHIESLTHLEHIREAFTIFMTRGINAKADQIEDELSKLKKKRKKKRKNRMTHPRRLVSPLFREEDNKSKEVDNNDEPFLTEFDKDTSEFKIARQYIDAHTELAMHMMSFAMSVTSQVSSMYKFDYYQCCMTLDRLMAATDLFTYAIEAMQQLAEDSYGIGTAKSKEAMYSQGVMPTSTYVLGLMKNLIVSVENAEARASYLNKSTYFSGPTTRDEFDGQAEEDRLIFHSRFVDGDIVRAHLGNLRWATVNAIEEFIRLTQQGLPADIVDGYKNTVAKMRKQIDSGRKAKTVKDEQNSNEL